MSKTKPATISPEASDDLRNAAHDLFQNALDRRILLYLHKEGESSFADIYRAGETTSKNHFQRSLTRLQDHILIDRRVEQVGKRYWSRYSLTTRGQLFAEILVDIAASVPKNRQGLSEVVRQEILATPA